MVVGSDEALFGGVRSSEEFRYPRIRPIGGWKSSSKLFIHVGRRYPNQVKTSLLIWSSSRAAQAVSNGNVPMPCDSVSNFKELVVVTANYMVVRKLGYNSCIRVVLILGCETQLWRHRSADRCPAVQHNKSYRRPRIRRPGLREFVFSRTISPATKVAL